MNKIDAFIKNNSDNLKLSKPIKDYDYYINFIKFIEKLTPQQKYIKYKTKYLQLKKLQNL
jgi:hypothetical protein